MLNMPFDSGYLLKHLACNPIIIFFVWGRKNNEQLICVPERSFVQMRFHQQPLNIESKQTDFKHKKIGSSQILLLHSLPLLSQTIFEGGKWGLISKTTLDIFYGCEITLHLQYGKRLQNAAAVSYIYIPLKTGLSLLSKVQSILQSPLLFGTVLLF